MIAILAGTRRQYENYLRESGLHRQNTRCVLNDTHLIGCEFEEYRETGTWYMHDGELLNMWQFYKQYRVKKGKP